MAKKTYTAQEREQLVRQLLDRGQALFAQHGYRAASLQDVYEPLGISKTYFYTFFSSKEALAIQVLYRQRVQMLERARALVRGARSWREGVETIFELFFHGRGHGVFVLDMEDLPYLCRHMSNEEQRNFRAGLTDFYRELLDLLDIHTTQRECQLIQNMVSQLLLTYHSRLYSTLPFLPGLEEETMSLQSKLIIDHLEQIHRRSGPTS